MKCYTIREEAHKGLIVRDRNLAEEVDPSLIIGAPDTMTQIPLGGELRHLFCKAAEFGWDTWHLLRADISTYGSMRLIRQRSKRDSRALVHVETESGDNGSLCFLANSYDEELRHGHVRRCYHIFPSTGVEVVATGTSESGCPHGLFIMCPGSSFRIERSGELEGASPVLIVVWTGATMQCFPPRKYQQN